jgi:hypothetical protein
VGHHVTYVKAKHWSSWHLLRTWTRVSGRAITVCGRQVADAVINIGVPAMKTCEACFRIDASHRETA